MERYEDVIKPTKNEDVIPFVTPFSNKTLSNFATKRNAEWSWI